MSETNRDSTGYLLDNDIFDWENWIEKSNGSNQPGIDVNSEEYAAKKAKWNQPDVEQHHSNSNTSSSEIFVNFGNGPSYAIKNNISRIEMQDLSSLAELLEKALNESNSTNLRSIFESYFQIDCSILFKSKDRIYGSCFIFNHYLSLLNTFSNCSFRFSVKERHHCLIVLEELCIGKCDCPTTESHQSIYDFNYLWKCFDILNFPSENESLLFRKKFYDKLCMSNMSLCFNLKLDLYLVMNEDMSRITHATWEVVSLYFTDTSFCVRDW